MTENCFFYQNQLSVDRNKFKLIFKKEIIFGYDLQTSFSKNERAKTRLTSRVISLNKRVSDFLNSF